LSRVLKWDRLHPFLLAQFIPECYHSPVSALPNLPILASSSTALPSLLDITLEDIAWGLDNGRFTVLDLVKAYTKRIDEVDDHFRSIIEVNPDAEAIARSLDEEIKKSGRRG